MSRPPRLDTAGMWAAAAAWPEQLVDALEPATRVFGPPGSGTLPRPQRVVAVGFGTGGAACDAVAALAAAQLAVPFVALHDSAPPPFVGPECLFLAVSCGTPSPETTAAARDAHVRGASVVGIGHDAGLELLAADAGISWCPTQPEGAAARAGLGAAIVSILVALSANGLLPDCGAPVAAASAFLARRRDSFLADSGPAVDLARRIGRTMPLVYGSSGIASVAARWWKSCVNLNAKAPAFAAELPGLAYDELAGWGQGGDITRQTMTLLLLRHGGEPNGAAPLFAAVRNATEEVMADVLDVVAEGTDDLTRFLDLALLGQLVSLELAAPEGVDPGPVPAVDGAHAPPT